MTVASAFVAFLAYCLLPLHTSYLSNTCENRKAKMSASSLLRIHSSYHLRSVLNSLLSMESTLHS